MRSFHNFVVETGCFGIFILIVFTSLPILGQSDDPWIIDNKKDWKTRINQSSDVTLRKDAVRPAKKSGTFRSRLKTYAKKRSPESLTIQQTRSWPNWSLETGIAPGGKDAPVFVVSGKNDYWYLNASRGGGPYHAWHSTDMKNWTLHSNAVGEDWVTTAEHADGRFYIYYDQPNDEDPHLIIDRDLTDQKKRRVGKVFADPSHGSDSGVFRAEDGSFHLIYEDWTDINASEHNWDSELAGHAESPDGINGFQPHEHPPFIDKRGDRIDGIRKYKHPNGVYEYQPRAEPIDAFGDYTMIRVGRTYYLFCDYDPHQQPMRVGYWHGTKLRKPFQWGGELGKGFHPDPSLGFAEGRFYLFVQRQKGTYVSSGPWVPKVKARAGVDQDDDGTADQWTSWQTVKETYTRKPGFSRIVETGPAQIDLSSLPSGKGFQFEIKLQKTTRWSPAIDRVQMSFQEK